MRGRALLATSVFVASCVATADAPVNFPPARRARKVVTDGPTDEPSPAPPALHSGAYDLGQLPVLSKVLFYLQEDYFNKRRLDYEDMAMGALDFLQRDVPEVVVDRQSDRTLSVTVADARRTFAFADVDKPWKLRSTLQRIFQFVQANLPAAAPESEGRRLLNIETAAVNGMLYALDPHSVLLDAATYAEMAARRSEDRAGSVGVFLRVDAAGRIVVTDLPPSSPAGPAGIGVGDRITHIDGEPTQNMMLDEVVDRLLGPVGSEVLLTVEHSDRRAPQRKTVVRAMVRFPSISPGARLLPGNVGYFHLHHLASGAALEVHEALLSFNRAQASGVIMDLRGNKGGLYEQAAKVADEFVDQGTIVSLIGPGGSPRKDETATGTAPMPQLPLIVLVDHETASGAEVIAAAMKNLDRGVVVGEPTFGSGSVQVLFDIPSPLVGDPSAPPERLGLKLMTAQILAAGGAARQDWGVVPDVVTEPVSVPEKDRSAPVHLQPPPYPTERDYEHSLPSPTGRPRGLPPEPIRYVREEDDGFRPIDPETDPVTALARELLRQNRGFARHELLGGSDEALASWRAEQDRRVVAGLARRGIDWSSGPPAPPAALQLTLERVDLQPATPGQPIVIRGTVKNLGSTTAFRVRAVVASEDPTFDNGELVFGRIPPGQSQSDDLWVTQEEAFSTRTALLKARLVAQDHPLAGATALRVDLEAAPQPTLAFRYQVIAGAGNRIEIPVTVTNRGPGTIAHVRATLVTRAGPRVSIPKGRFELRDLAAGASQKITFVAVPEASYAPDHCLFKVALETASVETVDHSIRIAAPPRQVDAQAVEVEPPHLTVHGPTVADSAVVRIEGTAASERGVRDVYIRVWNRKLKIPVRKVFYQSNHPAAAPQLGFVADVALAAGLNVVQVFARDTADVESQQRLVVLRPR